MIASALYVQIGLQHFLIVIGRDILDAIEIKSEFDVFHELVGELEFMIADPGQAVEAI